MVEIYTDGACRGNPGPGGWGAILRFGEVEKELRGAVADTTNNRMEMTAAIRSLQALRRPCSIVLHTDSTYLRDGILRWLDGWKARGWRTAARKPVKNRDLWEELEEARAQHEIDWRWVRGHTGVPGNERADALANLALDEMLAGDSGNSVDSGDMVETFDLG